MKAQQSGFTLIELMVVVMIVGIISAIAYPSYREQVRRSNRSEAKIALEEKAQALEKCFTRSMDFTSAACANARANVFTPNRTYQVGVNPGIPTTATTFALIATPQGNQAGDAECLNFTLNESGLRGVSGSASATPERCW
jgi:type IV pilus assembly protein PilE